MEKLNESLSGEKDEATHARMEMKEPRERLKTTLEPTMLPEYPKHGVIGLVEPERSPFFEPTSKSHQDAKNYRKQKFDFHSMYEKNIPSTCRPSGEAPVAGSPLPGLGYLYRGLKTSDVYKVDKSLPIRFQNPDLLEGYGCEKPEHPFFRTTTSEYGKFPPTVHDVPHVYHGLKNKFTRHISSTGMPKNRSLNMK